MLVFFQRKHKIIKEIKKREEYFDYIMDNCYFDNEIKSLDKIKKYLVNYDKLDELLNNDILIAKHEFQKKAITPVLSMFNYLNNTQKQHANSPTSLFYRGYSFDDLNIINDNKPTKQKFTTNTWIAKGYLPYKAEEIAKKYYDDLNYEHIISTQSCFSKYFWIERGYSEEEAIEKVRQIQAKNNSKMLEKYDNLSDYDKKLRSNTTLEYYLNLGYSEEEAISLRKKRQTVFSLDICIEKYGNERGHEIWKERQEKWQNTMKSKPIDEINEINSRKGRTRDQLIEEYGKEKAEEIIRKRMSLTFGGASKESLQKMIYPAMTMLQNNKVDTSRCYYGSDGRNEYGIHDYDNKKTFYYDFTIYDKKIIIEYHGKLFHADTRLDENEIQMFNETNPFLLDYHDMMNRDNIKKQVAIDNGFEYYVIWYYNTESEIKNILEEICEKCLLK